MSATGVSIDLVRELRAICGEEYVAEFVRHGEGHFLLPSESRRGQ